eukprot:m.135585 g.135585  ORF g.135585 m.135585 type:complete len:79 (-) comp15851_c0_seq2:309-545(-)
MPNSMYDLQVVRAKVAMLFFFPSQSLYTHKYTQPCLHVQSFIRTYSQHHLTDRDSCVSVVEAMVGGISSLTLSTCLLH